jgi:hypothetical protein
VSDPDLLPFRVVAQMAKAVKRSKSSKRKSKRVKRPVRSPPVKQLRSEAPAGLVEKLRELNARAGAHWAALPEMISAEDRAGIDRALAIRDGLRPAEKPAAPSKSAPYRPAAPVERGETTKQTALRYIADKYCPDGKPRHMSWRNFADIRIARRWGEACDACDLPQSRRPTPPSPKTVSRFFRQRSARG